MIRYFLGAALAALSLTAGSAMAQPRAASPDVMVVRLNDLDTTHAAGAQVALRRIHAAALKFCDDDTSLDLGRQSDSRKCVQRMTAKAVDALDAVEVTALYRATSPYQGDAIDHALQLASRDPR